MICVDCQNKTICNIYATKQSHLGEVAISIGTCNYFNEKQKRTFSDNRPALTRCDEETFIPSYDDKEDKIRAFYEEETNDKEPLKCKICSCIVDPDSDYVIDIQTGNLTCESCWQEEEED